MDPSSLKQWAGHRPIGEAAIETDIGREACGQVYQYLRDACSWYLNLPENAIKLGGCGIHAGTVEVDESCFSHKPKHHRGHPPRSQVWVFGMVDTSTTPATGFMQIVLRRDAQTLEGIIAAHLHDGSAVRSDQWAAYRHLCDLPQVREHRTVNHSEHFKDPATGVHTNHIESYWNRVKMNIKRMRGCRRDQLAGHLDEFMWRERWGKNRKEAFDNILSTIAKWYDPVTAGRGVE
ncbi:uncharacterized protein [Oscarella lobularis]|uniref:uncharacterized protein n=1 Tax=Oscarella lobularis TaxID=121494 RepID=UPI0033136A60